MNKQIVKNVLGRILMIIGALMALPVIVSLVYREPLINTLSFLITGLVVVGIGFILSHPTVDNHNFYAKEGFVIVSLAWVLISFVSAIPFVVSGEIPSLVDAFFEMSSGYTTTGASILTDVEALSHSMLFWRSFTHFIGGMGVLVFAMAIIPKVDSGSVHIMKAEMTGPTFGKLVSKITASARILYITYFVMMVIVIILLWLAGLPFFDSMLLGFGTAGTGGFGILNGSVAPYDSLPVELILGIGMILFGVNFNLYYMILHKHVKAALKNEELKWYLSIIVISILLITINLFTHSYGLGNALRDSFFTVASVITTTGYSTAFFDNWPLFSQLILLLLMFVGGMAGSTAGGIKVSRIVILVKSGWAEFKRTIRPNRVVTVQAENKPIQNSLVITVFGYLIIYILIFIGTLLLVSFETPDFMTAFSTVAATFNNIGPGLGMVGPSGNFDLFSPFIKIVLSFVMIAGRLEIFPVLILLSPNTWRKKF